MRSGLVTAILSLVVAHADAANLPASELEFVAAIVRHVAAESGTQRPVVLLSRTEKWLPRDSPPTKRPAEVPIDVWEQQQLTISRELRAANQSEYELSDLPAIPGVVTYPREQFETAMQSPPEFAKVVARLGAEPVVIKVSRPNLHSAARTGAVAVHSLSSWTGCGSFQVYSGALENGQWTFQPAGASIVW
jgi:hypothetical protein